MKIILELNSWECEETSYFKSLDSSIKFFVDFEIKFNSIYRYFHLNSVFLSEYFKTTRENMHALVEQESSKANEYAHCFFLNFEGFKEIHNMSTLMILYTNFEALLKSVTKDIAYDFNMDIEEIQKENLPYINGYIGFLHEKFKPHFIMDSDEFEFMNILRKIRNGYLHDSSTFIPDSMKKELLTLLKRKGNKIIIDDFFLEDIFELIGKIATQLQKSYLIYYANYKK